MSAYVFAVISAAVGCLGLLLAIMGLVWRGGGMHRELQIHAREIKELKAAVASTDDHAITREEFEARMNEMKAIVGSVRERVDDVYTFVKEAVKR